MVLAVEDNGQLVASTNEDPSYTAAVLEWFMFDFSMSVCRCFVAEPLKKQVQTELTNLSDARNRERGTVNANR